MKLIKSVIIVAVAATAAFSLTGCGDVTSAEEPHNESITEYTVEIPTGDTVNCLLFDSAASAGLVCDWKNLNAAATENVNFYRLTGSVESLNGAELLCISYDGGKEGALDCNIDADK